MNYAPYEQIAALFPIQPAASEQTLTRWSREEKFPPYVRILNHKSPALWDLDAVKKWVAEKYAPLFNTKKAKREK
jgi:hypothetical protein